MKIGIVGLGYVGLCTAVCLADRGFDIVGVDLDGRKIRMIRKCRPPFYERGLDPLLNRAISTGRMKCSNSYENLKGTNLIFMTVGTPTLRDGSIDLSQVKASAEGLARIIKRNDRFPLVVVKSTVIPGTTGRIVKPILEKQSGKHFGSDFGLCSNPEFLREGSAIEDTLHPDKIVIGAEDERSAKALISLYTSYYSGAVPPLVRTNFAAAELIKYANNAFLAMKVSYINSVARICEKIPGSDVGKVAQAIGLDSRIGRKFLEAGPGYGGSCFPKDLRALIEFSKTLGATSPLITGIEQVNRGQVQHVVSIARKMLRGLRGKRVSILGLAFKAGTNDIRESPSIEVISQLLVHRAKVIVYDPKAVEDTRRVFGRRITYSPTALDTIKGCDLCIIMTAWEEFKKLKEEDFLANMKNAAVLDARRILNFDEFSPRVKFTAIGQGGRINRT